MSVRYWFKRSSGINADAKSRTCRRAEDLDRSEQLSGAALPKSAHTGATKALAEIWNAEDNDHTRAAVNAFARRLRGQVPEGAGTLHTGTCRIA
jgi:hypothetical protein